MTDGMLSLEVFCVFIGHWSMVTKELESFVSPLRARDEIKAKRRTGAMRNSVCLATSVHCDLDLMCETTSTVIHKQKRNAPTCNG